MPLTRDSRHVWVPPNCHIPKNNLHATKFTCDDKPILGLLALRPLAETALTTKLLSALTSGTFKIGGKKFYNSKTQLKKSLIHQTEGEISKIPSYGRRPSGSYCIHVQYICEKIIIHRQPSHPPDEKKNRPDDRTVTLNHLDPFLIYVNLERDAIREHNTVARQSRAHAPSDTRHKSGLQARPSG